MALELKFRPKRSRFWYVEGEHLDVVVNRSTGTPDRATAKKILQQWKREIEVGSYTGPSNQNMVRIPARASLLCSVCNSERMVLCQNGMLVYSDGTSRACPKRPL